MLQIKYSIFFSLCTSSPWSDAPYKDAAEKNVLGGLSLEGFLSEVCDNAIFVSLFVYFMIFFHHNSSRSMEYLDHPIVGSLL